MEKKKILFIESSPTDCAAKLALALKKKGYETELVSITSSENSFLKKSYDSIASFDFKFFKINLKNLPGIFLHGLKKFKSISSAVSKLRKNNADIVIARSNPNWPCALARKYFKKSVFVYFPYDSRSLGFKDFSNAVKAGVPKFEINSEAYCFENADGIMYKGVENKLDFLNEKVFNRKLKINAPTLHILPFLSEDLIFPINKEKLSKKDKEIHLAFVGHLGTEDSWINSIKMVLNQGIHLHLYGKTANISKEESEKKREYASFMESKYFHVHEQLSQEELIKEISKYDYGIWLGYYDNKSITIKVDTGNKFATYLEAGLPIIYFKNHEYIGKSLDDIGPGVGIGITIDAPLKKILKKTNKNYKKIIKIIEKSRKKLTFEHNLAKILKFFAEAEKYKFKR